MEALHPAGSKLAAALAEALAQQVHAAVEVRFAHVQRRTFLEILTAEGVPPCLYYLQAAGQCAGWVQFSSNVFLPMLDCLLGGDGRHVPASPRAMTYVERRLGRRLIAAAAAQVSRLLGGPDSPPLTPGEPPASPPGPQPFIEISFTVLAVDQPGMLRIGLDSALVRALPLVETARPLGIMELSVTSPETAIPADELASLAPGDILATDIDADAPVVIRLAGIPKYSARLGSYEGRRAVTVIGRLK